MPSSSCLYAGDGRPIAGSALECGPRDQVEFPYGVPQRIDPQTVVANAELVPSAVFLPYSDLAPFGHCLTEGAAWIWPFLDADSNPLVRMDPGTSVLIVDRPGAPQPIAPMAELLQVPLDRIQTTSSLQRPLLCRRVVLPVPSMINRRWLAPHHFEAVQQMLDRRHQRTASDRAEVKRAAADPASPGKVYLSRSRLGAEFRRLHGETRLEEQLRRRGWRIIHPQELSIDEQLQVLARARTLAGEVGSAFHLLMGLGCEFARKTVVMLGVRAAHRDPRVANFIAQFRQQPVSFRYLACLGFCSRPSAAGSMVGIPRFFDRRFLAPTAMVAERLERLAAASIES